MKDQSPCFNGIVLSQGLLFFANKPTSLTCANMTLIKSYIFSIIKVNVYYGGLNHED